MHGDIRLRSKKALSIAMGVTFILLTFFLFVILSTGCKTRPPKYTETPVIIPPGISKPLPTLTLEPSISPTKTATSTEQIQLPTRTQTPYPKTPTLTATDTPTEVLACIWPPQRVLIISVDSLRPDAVRDTTAAPFLLNFARQGSYTWNAQTTMPSITMTGHLSMLSGYDATTHGVINNKIWQTPEAVVEIPTIFQRANEANLTTALFSGKGHLLYIERAGFQDFSYVDKAAKDAEIAERVVDYIINNDFNLMFINLANVDKTGHAYGWMSNEQLLTISIADSAVQTIVGALEAKGILASTLIIINSDHGGTGISHGDAHIPTNRTIPWMINGPCVKPGYQVQQDVNVFDTAAMALWGLGIEIPADLDGKLVCDVFQTPVSNQCLEAQPKK